MSGISLTSPDTHQPSCGTELRTLKTHQEPFKPPQEPPHGPLEPDQEQLEHPRNPQILQMNPVQFSTDHETSDPRNFLSTPQEVLKPPQEPPTLLKQPREPLKPYAEIKSTPVTTWVIKGNLNLLKNIFSFIGFHVFTTRSFRTLSEPLENHEFPWPNKDFYNLLKNQNLIKNIWDTLKNLFNHVKGYWRELQNLWTSSKYL